MPRRVLLGLHPLQERRPGCQPCQRPIRRVEEWKTVPNVQSCNSFSCRLSFDHDRAEKGLPRHLCYFFMLAFSHITRRADESEKDRSRSWLLPMFSNKVHKISSHTF